MLVPSPSSWDRMHRYASTFVLAVFALLVAGCPRACGNAAYNGTVRTAMSDHVWDVPFDELAEAVDRMALAEHGVDDAPDLVAGQPWRVATSAEGPWTEVTVTADGAAWRVDVRSGASADDDGVVDGQSALELLERVDADAAAEVRTAAQAEAEAARARAEERRACAGRVVRGETDE